MRYVDYTIYRLYWVDPPHYEQQTCSKHVEAYYWNKLIENSAYCWFILYGYITMHGQQNIKSEEMFTDIPFFSTSWWRIWYEYCYSKDWGHGLEEKKPVLVIVNSIFQGICSVINESLQWMYGKCPCRNFGWRNKLHLYIVVPDWHLWVSWVCEY